MMEAALEWVSSCEALAPDLKMELGEKLASAKAEAEATIFSLERASKASSDKCREQASTIEALETRALNAEARAAASEVKENELRLSNEKMTEQLKALEERVQLRLAEQKDLAGFLESKTEEANRLRNDLRTTSDALNRAQEARIAATLEAESSAAREEALKAEIVRLRARLEASIKQTADLRAEMSSQREELVETARDRGIKALQCQMALSDKIEELKITQNSLEDYKKMVEDQREKVKELVDQLHRVQENSSILENNFKSQLDAQRQLANLYEENAKSSEARAKALEERGKELDEAFSTANEEYRVELERLLGQIRDATVAIDERDAAIRDLKKELEDANKLIEKLQKHG